MPGASGQFKIQDEKGHRRLSDKPNEVTVHRGAMVTVETPGAGGYGNPDNRSHEAIKTDQESGKFTRDFIVKNYPNSINGGQS